MYAEHRRAYLAALREQGAAAVIPTAVPKIRSNDSEYRFRPHSDFWYLTGFGEPGAVLVLLPGLEDGEEDRCVLFLRERNKEQEIWNGRRVGVERAPGLLGVDEARDIDQLWKDLPELLTGYRRIQYATGLEPERDGKILETLAAVRRRARPPKLPPHELVEPAATLHELRLLKSEEELERMRRAAAITAEAHVLAMAEAAPGKNECELDALLDYTFRRRGGTGSAYGNIVAGGDNACILHYVENDMPLRDGDLLLIDAGAEYELYACDVTRTFPINGTFTPDQRAIYELVLAAQHVAIAEVGPGKTFQAAHDAAAARIIDGLVELGLLEGEREEILESGEYRRFFMHKTGHWLGLDVHDCGSYAGPDRGSRPLEPGMVVTVEPGIYIAADDESVDERWRGIGVRIEDDVLVTPTGNEVLTAAIPKEPDEVEAACRPGAPALV